VVNEDAVGTNLMLKAELHRVKVQLAALHGQPPALDAALATSLAFDDQPNTAAAQAAQVSPQNPLHLFHQSSFFSSFYGNIWFCKKQGTEFAHSIGLSQAFVAWFANSSCLGDERQAVLQTIVASL